MTEIRHQLCGEQTFKSLFLLSALRASYGKLRFPESSLFGRRPFKRIGFQPTRFELTDQFALQLYDARKFIN